MLTSRRPGSVLPQPGCIGTVVKLSPTGPGPISARPAEIPGYFTGLDRAERGEGRGDQHSYSRQADLPRHLPVSSPVLACCDGRRAQSWFVKAVSCLPTSPHLTSPPSTTGHNLGAEILLTTAPTTNLQGEQQYSKTTSTTTVFSQHQANTEAQFYCRLNSFSQF